jgi:hypothetical protein
MVSVFVSVTVLASLPVIGRQPLKTSCKVVMSFVETKNFYIEQCADGKGAYAGGESHTCPVTIITKRGKRFDLPLLKGKACYNKENTLGSLGNITYSLRLQPNNDGAGTDRPVRFIVKRAGKTIINESVIDYMGADYTP